MQKVHGMQSSECSLCGAKAHALPYTQHRRCVGYKKKNPKPRDRHLKLSPRKRGYWKEILERIGGDRSGGAL